MEASQRQAAEQTASALIEAIIEPGWRGVAAIVRRVLGQGEESRERSIDAELAETSSRFEQAEGGQLGVVLQAARVQWTDRISDLIAEHAVTLEQAARLEAELRRASGFGAARHLGPPGPDYADHDFLTRGGPPGTTFGDGQDDE